MLLAEQLQAFKRKAFEQQRGLWPATVLINGTEYSVALQLPDVTLESQDKGLVEKRGAVVYLDKKDHPAEPVVNTLITHKEQARDYVVNRLTSRSASDIAWRLLCVQKDG